MVSETQVVAFKTRIFSPLWRTVFIAFRPLHRHITDESQFSVSLRAGYVTRNDAILLWVDRVEAEVRR